MLAPAPFRPYSGAMTVRFCLRLLLLAAMLLAPLGRLGMAQAMPGAAMTGDCATMAMASSHPGAHHRQAPAPDGEKMAVDCMIACAAMATAPAPFVTPPPAAAARPEPLGLASLTGIMPEADPPPPRLS